MSGARTCSHCGSPIPAGAPDGPCPDADAPTLTLTLTRVGGASATVSPPGGVLDTIAAIFGAVPRVVLGDTAPGEEPSPIVSPSSPEMPAGPGRLQLLGEIARGGMGAVLKGRDLGRDLAVKVLLKQHRTNPDLVRRFVEEAQIAGQLQHPGIVPLYELGQFADARPYVSMKLV